MANITNITKEIFTFEANESLGTPVPFFVNNQIEIVAPGFESFIRDLNGVKILIDQNSNLFSAQDFPYLTAYGFAKIPGYETAMAVSKSLNPSSPTGLFSYSPSTGWTLIDSMQLVPHYYVAGEFDLNGELYIPTYYGINAPRFIKWSNRNGFTYPDNVLADRFFSSVAIVANRNRTKLYILPYIGEKRILKIDVVNNVVEYIGPEFPVDIVKFGPQLPYPLYIGSDDKIYLSSYELEQFVRIDPNTDEVEFYGNTAYIGDSRFIGAIPIRQGKFILSTSKSPSQPLSYFKLYSIDHNVWFVSPTPMSVQEFGNVFGLGIDLSTIKNKNTIVFPGANTISVDYNVPMFYQINSQVARLKIKNVIEKTLVNVREQSSFKINNKILYKCIKVRTIKTKAFFKQQKKKSLELSTAIRNEAPQEFFTFLSWKRPKKEELHKKSIISINVKETQLERLKNIPYWSSAIAFAFKDVLKVSTTPQEALTMQLNTENMFEYKIKIQKSEEWKIQDIRVILTNSSVLLQPQFYENLKLNIENKEQYIDITDWLKEQSKIDYENGTVELPGSFIFLQSEIAQFKVQGNVIKKLSKFAYSPVWEKFNVYIFYTATYDMVEDIFDKPFIYKTITELEDTYGKISPSNWLTYSAALHKQTYPEQQVIIGLGKTIESAFEKLAKDPNIYSIAVASPVESLNDILKITHLAEQYNKIAIVSLSPKLFYLSKQKQEIMDNLISIISDVRSARVRLVMNPEFIFERPIEYGKDVLPSSMYTVLLAGAIAQKHRKGQPNEYLTTAFSKSLATPFWRLSNVDLFTVKELIELSNKGYWIVDDSINAVGVIDQVTTEKSNKIFFKEPSIRIVDYVKWYLTLKAKEQIPRQTALQREEVILNAINLGISELVNQKVIVNGRISKYKIEEQKLFVNVEISIGINILNTLEVQLTIGA